MSTETVKDRVLTVLENTRTPLTAEQIAEISGCLESEVWNILKHWEQYGLDLVQIEGRWFLV